ncbi:zinc finger protein [Scheffersomyces xylosifermentans]|uniref:zinc finger protein n=1 Tax=Scheffersomyces xylosifermentans TaxID=1304137 RepID=UPI00315D9A11
MSYRTSTALPSSKKTHSEKHKAILKQLLKENANKTCADCKTSKNPRWASWSLGCFICIRCSGIHRSMGTHISKVKSVDLDAWTDDQIENMVKWGNERCNAFWEAKLPDDYIPDQSKIESFIRTKYDIKKWAASSTVPNPLSIKVTQSSTSAQNVVAPTATSSRSANVDLLSSQSTSKAKTSDSGLLLNDDFGAFTSSPSPKPQAIQTNNNSLPKLPTSSVQSAQSTGGSIASNNGRPDLKKSILSLYSSPSSSTSFIQPQQQQQRYQSHSPNPVASVNSLGNSLQGLNFGGSPAPQNSTNSNPSTSSSSFNSLNNYQGSINFSQQRLANNSTTNSYNSGNSRQAGNNWNNEWAENTPTNQWERSASANGNAASVNANVLDDELFKNVWS